MHLPAMQREGTERLLHVHCPSLRLARSSGHILLHLLRLLTCDVFERCLPHAPASCACLMCLRRNTNSPSEDPWHTGAYGAEVVQGMQGDGKHRLIAAQMKHWTAYSVEANRMGEYSHRKMHAGPPTPACPHWLRGHIYPCLPALAAW